MTTDNARSPINTDTSTREFEFQKCGTLVGTNGHAQHTVRLCRGCNCSGNDRDSPFFCLMIIHIRAWY